MHSGRNNRLDGRVPIPINRGTAGYVPKHVDSEKKPPGVGKQAATSVVNLPDDKKVPKKATNIPRMRQAKVGEYQVSQSIHKLLSMYEGGEKAKGKLPDDRNAKPQDATRISSMDKQRGKRVIPVITERTKPDLQERNIRCRKIPTRTTKPEVAKPSINTITESIIITSVSQNKKNAEAVSPAADTKSNRLIPIMTPEHHVEASVDIFNSFITSCLDEKAENRPLDFLLRGCDDRSVFPVCSKKATDNIPTSELSSNDGQPQEKIDLTVMRRRNSEPYSPNSCLLQYADKPGSWNLASRTIQNYYLWEPGPAQHLRPYWEVSPFKYNRSLSVLNSRVASGLISLNPPTDTGEILREERIRKVIEKKPSLLQEVTSITDDIHKTPFVTLMEKGRVLSREPEIQPKEKEEPRRRPPHVFSKDDQYKPPGHLLIYVKSSQKKLVTVEERDNRPLNKKVHKLTKIRGINSDVRATSLDKKMVATVSTAIFFIVVAVAFLLYFHMKRHSAFNLTPPIPGLLRGL